MNRREELKQLLIQALASDEGLVFTISGGGKGARQQALVALSAAKRELAQDEKGVLDLLCRPAPGTADKISIMKWRTNGHDPS